MIDPKSLRTGNILENGIVVTVQYSNGVFGCIITQSNYSSGHDWEFTSLADLKALPLSPSLLERAGFDTITDNPDGSQNYWNKEEDCSIDVETHILTTKLEILFYFRLGGNNRKALRDLHKLQNLFYDLKDKELELKP